MKHSPSFLILFSLFILLISGNAATEVINKIVAIVNEDVITLKDLNERIAFISKQNKDFNTDQPSIDPKEILSELIDEKLAESKAKELGIKVTEAELNEFVKRIMQQNFLTEEEFTEKLKQSNMTFEDFKSNIRKDLLREKLLSQEVRGKIIVSDESIRNYYENNKAKFQTPDSVRLSAIFLPLDPVEHQKTVESAFQILKRIRSGERFEELVKEYSVGPGKNASGSLGLFKISELHPELAKVIRNLKQGEVSEPLLLGNYVQILKVEERLGGVEAPFEEVKEVIREELYREELQRRFREFVEELKASSYVKVLY